MNKCELFKKENLLTNLHENLHDEENVKLKIIIKTLMYKKNETTLKCINVHCSV